MKRIFITGASGCIGHYLTEMLIEKTDHELFLLVRNPERLKFNYDYRPGITVIEGDLLDIEQYGDFLKTINVAILVAAAWGGMSESRDINVLKPIRLINLLDPEVCEQIIYFSTASILDRNQQPLKKAGELGTDYIRTKYECFTQLSRLNIASKITTVFPTLVFGGDDKKPKSHLSSGLNDVIKWIGLARWFTGDGSFHFIHTQDIAQVIYFLVENPPQNPDFFSSERLLVLGYDALTIEQAIKEICDYLGKKIYFQIPLSIWLANFFINVFQIKMAAWDRFCLEYRHFTYERVVSPRSFGLTNYCSSLSDVLAVSGIIRK
jgi:nucleoside-diphosphate-sugar epimerase